MLKTTESEPPGCPALKLSKYSRIVAIGNGEADGCLAYSGISGHIYALDDHVTSTLRLAQDRPDRLVNADSLPAEVRSTLCEARILVNDLSYEQKILQLLDKAIAATRAGVQQFTILPDWSAASSAEITGHAERLFAGIGAYLKETKPERIFIHFWWFDENQLPQLDILFREYDRWFNANAAVLPKCVTTINSSGVLPLPFHRYPVLRRTKTYYCIYTDELLAECFPSLQSYINRVSDGMLEAAEIGIVPMLHLLVNRSNAHIFLHEVFEYFMLSGIFYSLITTFNLVPIRPRRAVQELYCPWHGNDTDLCVDLRNVMCKKERYRLFTVLGGVSTKLEGCIKQQVTRMLPDTCACPIMTNGLVFTVSGSVWTCPIIALATDPNNRIDSVGTFVPQLSLETELLRAWRDRLSTRIVGCQNCPDSLICGGGCAYDALTSSGSWDEPACSPVAALAANAMACYPSSFRQLKAESAL